MPFVRPTLDEIVDRIESDMESRLTGNSVLLRWGILRILARVFAGAMHILYGLLEYLADQLFATSAELEYLNRIGLMFGVTRKAAAFATGTLQFLGTNGTLVPEGTRVATEEGEEYETTADGTITAGSANIAATAVVPGTAGNTIVVPVEMVEPIAGISAVNMSSTFEGGEDEETDDEYRSRILQRLQNPPAGGTAADYERWAQEVSGVDNAWTFAATPGPGQVTLIYRGSALIATVQAYIDERMPVTTDLTVDKTDDKTITMTILIDPDNADFRDAIESNLTDHFAEVAEPGEDMLISQIRNAISTTGVTDFDITALAKAGVPKSTDADIPFSGFEYGVLGTITFGAL
jgi:uncharacterized phage protein gp47/JayE